MQASLEYNLVLDCMPPAAGLTMQDLDDAILQRIVRYIGDKLIA